MKKIKVWAMSEDMALSGSAFKHKGRSQMKQFEITIRPVRRKARGK